MSVQSQSQWETRHIGTEREHYERDIGPYRLRVWPNGEWGVYVAGKMPKDGFIDSGGNRIEDAKRAAVAYVAGLHAAMSRDLGAQPAAPVEFRSRPNEYGNQYARVQIRHKGDRKWRTEHEWHLSDPFQVRVVDADAVSADPNEAQP